jgi:hypothetical protein
MSRAVVVELRNADDADDDRVDTNGANAAVVTPNEPPLLLLLAIMAIRAYRHRIIVIFLLWMTNGAKQSWPGFFADVIH